MKKKLKYVIIVLVCAALIWGVFMLVMLLAGDKILIYGHRGFDNMFAFTDAEYHAAIGGFSVKVPGAAVKLFYPKSENNDYSVYEDDDTARYFVQLIYNDSAPHGNVIDHGHYGKYTIEYQKKGSAEHTLDKAGADIENDMLAITEQLYDLDHVYEPGIDEWSAFSGGHGFGEPDRDSEITVTSFMLYCHDSGYLVVQNDKVVYSFCGGKLGKIMDVPEKGDFDYCIWKR